MLTVKKFTFNSFAEHTYVVYDETKACAIIDPGCFDPQEKQSLSNFIQTHGLQVSYLINTHCHIDHILGNQYVQDTYQVQLAIHPQEIPTLQFAATFASQYGFIDYKPIAAKIFLTAGHIIQLGNTLLTVLHVPGHSPGHIALYSSQEQICFVGDVLFRGNIGRTDLLGGNREALLRSIRKQLLTLDAQTTLYPGHGPTTTIAAEKRSNIFL